MPFETLVGRGAHLDVPLSNLVVEAFAGIDEYIGQRLFPVIPVDHESDKYYVVDQDSWLRVPNTRRARGQRPERIEFRISSDSYFADNYALAEDNFKEDLANADMAIRIRERSARNVMHGLARDLEVRIANRVTSGTNVGSYVSLTGGNKWSDPVASDPIADVTTAHAFIENNTGLRANTLVIDKDTLRVVRRHPVLLDLFKYTAGGVVNDQQLREVFEVETILIGRGRKNNALESATASFTNIWGNNVILARVQPGNTMQTMTFGLGFRWTPEGIPTPMSVVRYDDPDPGKKVETTEVGYYQDEKIIARNLAYLIAATL